MLETSPINAKFVQNSLTTKLTWDATCAYTRERSPSRAMFAAKVSSERTGWSSTRTRTRRRRRWAEAWCDNKPTRGDTCTGQGADTCPATITCDDRTWQQHRTTSGPRDARVWSSLPAIMNLSDESLVKHTHTHFLWSSIPWQDITPTCSHVSPQSTSHHLKWSRLDAICKQMSYQSNMKQWILINYIESDFVGALWKFNMFKRA